MKQGYLAQESLRVNRAARKTLVRTIALFLCALAVLYFLGKDSINFSDISYGSISFYLVILVALTLVCSVIKLIATSRPAVNGSNLVLPFGDSTKEAAGAVIDREALEGKILVDEFIDQFTDPNKANGEKVVLTPSYLLLCGVKGGPKSTSKVTAIPFHKIYWVCAQAGTKGGPFIVKLLIFTENKIYSLTGTDIRHVQSIADKLYQYIPNVFSDYDPFVLSYEFEKLFAKNPAEFFKIYEIEKKKASSGEPLQDH